MANEQCLDEYSQQITYLFQPGLLQMPAAGPSGSEASIVQVSAPCSQKVVVWRTKRTGGMPALPDPTPQNDNEVLADASITGTTPIRGADGQVEVLVEGKYIYFLRRPVWIHDPLAMGTSPVDSTPGANYMIRPEHFSRRLLEGNSPSKQSAEGVKTDDLGKDMAGLFAIQG